MAYCANCGNQISDLATTCPQCGTTTTAVAPVGGPPAGLPLAGFWIRVVASLLDGLVLGAAGYVVGGRGGGGFVLGFLYSWLMLAFNDGRTLGKMAMGIRIAKPDGSSLDLGTAAARSGMAIVSGLALGLGYLWAAWDPENRTWHDQVADTRAFQVR
jgi:uncharacterized RDD family membrane protein YckC